MENRTENGYCYSPLKEKYKLLGFKDRLGCCVFLHLIRIVLCSTSSQYFESLKNKVMEFV